MEAPVKPNDSDCCNSGCNPCILDVYEDQLRKYHIAVANNETVIPKKNCLSQTSYTVFKLIKVVRHTCNTQLLTFQACLIPDDETGLIYKPGQHFLLKGHYPSGKNDQFTRAYTPIPLNEAQNRLEFVILVKFYENGCMSDYLRHLKVGDKTLWRGPYGDFVLGYNFERILFIGQGTGITPLFALIKEILANFDCDTFLKLYFCCRTDDEILLRDELYALTSFWNFSYEVFLSSSTSTNSKYNEVIHESRLSGEFLEKYFASCDRDKVQILICGNELFNQNMFSQMVECGVDSNKVFLFYLISLLAFAPTKMVAFKKLICLGH